MVKPFENLTTNGSEKAIRKGKIVPDGGVNLSFFRTSPVTPENNLLIIDTSRAIEENISDQTAGCEVYYANEYGVLTDINGNVAFTDSAPYVTDEFLQEEDFSIIEGTEYTASDVLPFVHVSRYFHLDLAGLSIAGQQTPLESEAVKVVDRKGKEYDRYKTKIVPAAINGYSLTSDVWAYRVLVYIDVANREDLFLRYNKTEIDTDGRLIKQKSDYKETLNPQPFFNKVPEESEVIDPSNVRKKIYSTSALGIKDRQAGLIDYSTGGHKVFVPKKAVPDPRIYQLFRWRIKTSFVQERVVEDSLDTGTVKCGVLTDSRGTNTNFIPAIYALANLENSRYNSSKMKFENPEGEGEKTSSAYWAVDLETADLSQYDFLIWTPSNHSLDISKYTPKLNTYVKVHGGTLFFDTRSRIDAHKFFGGNLSKPVKVWSGANYAATRATVNGSVSVNEGDVTWNQDSELLSANSTLGGWDVTPTSAEFVSYFQFPTTDRFAQFFQTDPTGYERVFSSGGKSLVLASESVPGRGSMILSTIGIPQTCSVTFDYVTNSTITSASPPFGTSNYDLNISGAGVEGAMKILYNAVLLSLKNKTIREDDEESFSTSWVHETEWKSSWVINAFDDVLSDDEKQSNSFFMDAKDPLNDDFEPVWKRRLANKTVQEIVDEEIAELKKKNSTLADRLKDATRVYELQVTNPEVEVPSTVVENAAPEAWTLAYSPAFRVPPSLGPHIIKDVRDNDGIKGIRPEFSSDFLSYTDYPDQPYSGVVRALSAETQELAGLLKTNYTATGTATGKFKVTKTRDVKKTIEVSKTTSVLKKINWMTAHGVTSKSDSGSAIKEGSLYKANSFPKGFIKPVGIRTWQDYNYENSKFGPGNLLWPYAGFQSRELKGNNNDRVKFIQEALNRFAGAGYVSISKLKVDGDYGKKTKAAVLAFQEKIGARYVDGVVDAESWWLIMAWINRLEKDGKLGKNFLNLFDDATKVRMDRLSDGSVRAGYGKRSWVKGGPSTVWDLVAITFDKSYKIEKVSLTPYSIGEAEDILFQSIDVRNGNDLTNYNADVSEYVHMGKRLKTGVEFTMSIGPYTGDTIVLGIAQDKPYRKDQTARFLGLKDVSIHARVSQTDTEYQTVIEEQEYITEVSETFSFEVSGSLSLDARKDVVKQLALKDHPDKYESVSKINFDDITVTNAEVVASITSGGSATFSTQVVQDTFGTNVVDGSAFPGGTYYSKTPSGTVSNKVETGWVNKLEGIKLLCTKKGHPYGFPALPPSAGDELTRHNVSFSLSSMGSGPEVYLSFYDIKEQEFVTTPGENNPELSYIDYISRGPHNIFIAVISEYETVEQKAAPHDDDAPRIPYKRAMPAYGVCTSKGVEMSLENIPKNLGIRDIWPIAIRAGKFVKEYDVPTKSQIKLSGLLSKYQGETIECVYSIPEALNDTGSARFGVGVQDIKAETPSIETDTLLKVRQAPIHMAKLSTANDTKADPVRPVFTLYKRATINSPWVEVPRSEIEDVNTSTGEITLSTPLVSLDENLLKIDYSSDSPFYSMKKTKSGQTVNLNVFARQMPEYENKPIYVYIVPHYIRMDGAVVSESVNTKTVDITSNKEIFNPSSPEYDPLALQLGVVYPSTSSDIDKLAMFDTRRRGGGAKDGIASKELARLVDDALSYWDVDYGSGTSYPKQGFVVVRLPQNMYDYLDEEYVRETVANNMTAGVAASVVLDVE